MAVIAASRPGDSSPANRAIIVAGIALAAAAAAAYSRSFTVPFLYDDTPTIVQNPSIRHFVSSFVAPNNTTAGGRPILNLTLAANYWVSGTAVWSYHLLNLAIHIAAGLTLFGIVRRTLAPRLGPSALPVALAASLLWVVHPLQTESVTYIVQRAESLMGLFYLRTLYAFIRASDPKVRPALYWTGACVLFCALGMGTKEVMVSAPLVVLLYDRTFVSGTFSAALRRRTTLYVALAATWIPLGLLVISSHGRGGTAGTAAGMEWGRYAFAQFGAVAHYLWLAVSPWPLVFDYGVALGPPPLVLLCDIAVIALLAAATAWALFRLPALGFLGACFFAILAPSSSVVPVATETMAEHRMYLPLAPVIVMIALVLHRWLGRAFIPTCLVLAAVSLVLTFRRNETYQSELSLWQDTVAKAPSNERAHANLGASLLAAGLTDQALAEYSKAELLKPDDPEVQNDLGNIYIRLPRGLPEATSHFEQAVRLRPGYAEAHNNLASALARVPGRTPDVIAELREAVRLAPEDADMHESLGNVWMAVPGHAGEAASEFEAAARLNPGKALVRFNWGNALMSVPGKRDEAIKAYREALLIDPQYAPAHNNLGYALMSAPGSLEEAKSEFRAAIRIRNDYPRAHLNLGIALAQDRGSKEAAIVEFREVIRLQPENEDARRLLSGLIADHQ